MVREFFKSLPGILLIGAVCVALLIGLTYVFALAEGPLINIQRENIQQSQQYIESQVARLDAIHTEYLGLEAKIVNAGDNATMVGGLRGQQKALVNQMHRIADLIPASEVPSDIAKFLANHPKR